MIRRLNLTPLLFLFMVAGCSDVVPVLLRTTASTATLVSAGYRSVNAYDKTKQAAIVTRAKAGDPNGAQAELDAYVPKRNVALKALDDASVGVETAYAAIPAVNRVLDKKQRADLTGWVTTLLKLGADVVSALAVVGVKVTLPGGTP